MKISGIVTDIKEKIIGCRDRIPLILLAASILSGILNTVLYLTAAVFGTSQFVLLLNRITSVIAVIGSVCGFLLGLYLLILFKKTKTVWLAVAGAAFVISPVLSLFTIGNTGRAAAIGAVQWVLSLAASLALSAYEYGRGGRKAKDLGIAGFIVTAVQSFLNVIMTASAQKLYEVAGGRLLYLLQALTVAAGLVNTLIHLATICTASDAAGGVMDVVSSVLSKIYGKLKEVPGKAAAMFKKISAAKPEAPVLRNAETPAAGEQVNPAEEPEEEPAEETEEASAEDTEEKPAETVPEETETEEGPCLQPETASYAAETTGVTESVTAEAAEEIKEEETVPEERISSEPARVPAEILAAAAVSVPATGRIRYKTVAGPTEILVDKNDSYQSGVRVYEDIINREAASGWRFHSIYQIPVTRKTGCLSALFGRFNPTVSLNMIIFYRED